MDINSVYSWFRRIGGNEGLATCSFSEGRLMELSPSPVRSVLTPVARVRIEL